MALSPNGLFMLGEEVESKCNVTRLVSYANALLSEYIGESSSLYFLWLFIVIESLLNGFGSHSKPITHSLRRMQSYESLHFRDLERLAETLGRQTPNGPRNAPCHPFPNRKSSRQRPAPESS